MDYKKLKKRGERSLVWNYIGMFANKFVAFIVSIYLARQLEPEDFGLIAIVSVLIGYSTQLADIGYTSALIQQKKVFNIQYTTIFYINIIISLMFFSIFLLGASSISRFYVEPQLESIVMILSLLLIINTFAYIPRIILEKEVDFKSITQANFYKALTYGIVASLLVFWGFGVLSLVLGTLVGAVVFIIFLWKKVNWRPNLNFKWKSIVGLNRHGINFWITGMIRLIFDRADNLVLGKYFDMSLLGQYNRSFAVKGLVEGLSTAGLNRILFPIFSNLSDDKIILEKTVTKVFEVISFGVFLLIGLFSVIGKDLVVLIYTEKWSMAAEMFSILILTTISVPAYLIFNNVIAALKHTRVYLKLEIFNKFLLVLALVVAVWFENIYLYLYGLVFIAIVMNIVYVIYGGKFLSENVNKYLSIEIKYILITILTYFIVINSFELILFLNDFFKIIFVSILYIVLYFMINIFIGTNGYTIFKEYIYRFIAKKRGKKI